MSRRRNGPRVARDKRQQRTFCLQTQWSKAAVISNIVILVVMASCLGHFIALNSSGKVVDIAQQSLRPSAAAEHLLPLTSLAASVLQYFPGHQSRTAKMAQVWHARALAAARAAQSTTAQVQPILMNGGAYKVRWRFLGQDGVVTDLAQARQEAERWLSGAAPASVSRIARPTQIQFEWFVRTLELQSSGFDG